MFVEKAAHQKQYLMYQTPPLFRSVTEHYFKVRIVPERILQGIEAKNYLDPLTFIFWVT